jgi:surface polysaccharide O-acyltransferase-like enzyme
MIVERKSDYLLWPNLMKIYSISCVVLIHSAAPLLIEYPERGEAHWWTGNLYDSFGRWCIPIFFMLSGTFLIEKARRNNRLFFRQRCRRILLPFVLWSGVYFLWRVYANGENIPLSAFPSLLVRGPIFYHLWFLYVLMGLYLLAPILGIYLQNASTRDAAYLMGLWLLLGSLLPMIESFFEFSTYLSTGENPSLIHFVGYFVLGHLLRDKVLVDWKFAVFGLFLPAFLMTAWGTYYMTVIRSGGVFDGLFYEYFSINVFLMAVPVYLAGKSFEPPAFLRTVEERLGLVSVLSACVPGIYLVHPLLISVFKRGMLGFTLDQTTLYPAIGIPFFALAVLAASFLLVFALKQVPGMRYIVP